MLILGVMQGRLSPRVDGRLQAFPRYSWREEFARAAEAGCDCIEWIYDVETARENPLSSRSGINEIKAYSEITGVAVRSVCADYFMAERLITKEGKIASSSRDKLLWLMDQCRASGIVHMVLPFVDESSLCTESMRDAALNLLLSLNAELTSGTFELHIEADFDPNTFAAFMKEIPGYTIRINYDMGNSAASGYDPCLEFATYGSRIGSVHIKDRVRGGTTVPLGTGSIDIPLVLRLLAENRYTGPFILQAARGKEGDEVATITWYVKQMRALIEDAGFQKNLLEKG